MIKVDLITGFLGSGKTTFIKKYAKYLLDQGLKIGILENDYGAVNVDMMLLGELRGEKCELEMIAGGCDYDCHKRRFKTKLISMAMMGYDRIIVEPSGIFDVDEFFDVIYDEPLDNWYEIGNVLTIVDAALEEEMTKESNYLLACQVAKAGKIIFSHTNEASKEQKRNTITHINHALEEFKCKRSFSLEEMENSAELTDERTAKHEIIQKAWDDITDAEWKTILNSGYQRFDHVKMPISESNGYQSLYFMNQPLPKDKLEEIMQKLFQDDSYGAVFRIKGFMLIDGQWYEINANAKGIQMKKVSIGQEVVIVIGEALNEEKINGLWK